MGVFNPEIILQRTHEGRDEIYEKKRGLTQSERLVLIMIDGVTSSGGVRNKLPVLSDERFQRALLTLQKKELITEVFLPIAGQVADEVEKTVVDRFLQQDPTDPLTIISFNPEEEFGIIDMPAAAVPINQAPVTPGVPPPSPPPPPTPQVFEPAMDETLIRQADLLAQEVRAVQRRPERVEAKPEMKEAAPVQKRPELPEVQSALKSEPLHWGYWLIGLGLAFIGGYLLARLHS